MKKYLAIIFLLVGLMATAQNGEVFSVLKLEPQASAPTNAFWTNGSLYRHTDGTIYHKVGGSWVALGGTTVLNVLTSTSTTAALSAAQGKVLQDNKGGLSISNNWTGENTFAGSTTKIAYSGTYSPLFFKSATSNLLSQPVTNGSSIQFNSLGQLYVALANKTTGPNAYHDWQIATNNTGTRTYTFQDASGTVAFLSDVTGSTDDQTAAEVSVTASGFDGNLDTGDDTVQKVAQKLDDLVIDAGGGIVAQGFYDITSASGTSTFTITHGLGYTPSIARIGINIYRTDSETAIVNSPIIYNVTSTTFDVIVSNTGATTVMLSWRIFGATSETPLDFGEIATGLDTELGSSDWRTGGGSMTAAQVKDSLLANTNTNILTDAEQTKLGYITLSDDVDLDAWVDEIAEISGKIGSDTFGRTNATSIDDIYEQPHADYISDGAPASGKIVIIPDAPPSTVVTSATIDLNERDIKYNDQTADAATITFNNVKAGGSCTIYINRASAPTLAGAGLTFNQLPNTTAFASATDMAIYFEAIYDGTTIDYYYYER